MAFKSLSCHDNEEPDVRNPPAAVAAVAAVVVVVGVAAVVVVAAAVPSNMKKTVSFFVEKIAPKISELFSPINF